MSESTATPGCDSRGYPVLTRAEAHAIVQARKALEAITSRARRDAYGDNPCAVRRGVFVSEHAHDARDALTSFLIVANVHADSARANAALERS